MCRTAPPQSPGLPPSRVYYHDSNRKRDQFRRRHPAKRVRPTNTDRERIVSTAFAKMDGKSPEDIAKIVKRDVGTVRAVIRFAREALARRAEDYVELHWVATVVAASKGDARPAQWALERIQAEGEHVVEPPHRTHAETSACLAALA
jgi:hypothetical protein